MVVVLSVVVICLICLIIISELNDIPLINIFGSIVLTEFFHLWIKSIQNFKDNRNWKSTQTKLRRDGTITKKTKIRISFAYLFRVKVKNKYFLVQNTRGTTHFQPIGGVYKYYKPEAQYLRSRFGAENDQNVAVDEVSDCDYRLVIENKDLRAFVKRFDNTTEREKMPDLSREFREELMDTNILDFNSFSRVEYIYCGRHFDDLKFSSYFQCYELVMADILEVCLSSKQEKAIGELKKDTDLYIFATAEEIESLGIHSNNSNLKQRIADHTVKILPNHSDGLVKNNKTQQRLFFEITR